MREINIEGINLYAYHGCLPEETKVGGQYIVNVNLVYDFSKSAITDDLTQTIDYCQIFEICKKEMATPSKLIEHVCNRIHKHICNVFPEIMRAKVSVIKLLPPMNGPVDRVSVSIEN